MIRDTLLDYTHAVGANVSLAQTNLMKAFSLTEGNAEQIRLLAEELKISTQTPDGKPTTPDLKGLQLITQQRFEHATQIFNTFSNIMDKLDQLKQRLIQKMGQ
jgi:hypothetical protein